MGASNCSEDKRSDHHKKRRSSKTAQQSEPITTNTAANNPTACTNRSTGATAAGAGGGGGNSSTINSYDKCMLQLKLQRDKLAAASRLYERKAEVETEAARQLLRDGKREKALYCLKRKKAQEVHLSRVQQYLDNIMVMMQNVEAKQLDNEVATALKQGADELKALNEHLSLDDIEAIMDSAAEQIQITDEASALLAQNLGSSALDAVDDDDLLAELDAACAADGIKKSNNKAAASKAASVTTASGAAGVISDQQQLQSQLQTVAVPTGAVVGEVTPNASAEVVAEEEEEEAEAEAPRTAVAA